MHLYDNSVLRWKLASGNAIKITQQTRYPWEGSVELRTAVAAPEEFTLFVRIPEWSKQSSVKVNGKPVEGVTPGNYAAIRRRWTGEERVELEFDMTPQMVRANPAVADDTGRVAVQRGPVVFCMEQLDQTANSQEEFPRVTTKLSAKSDAHFDPRLLDGVVVLTHTGTVEAAQSESLYQAAAVSKGPGKEISLKLIPYYAWANREPSSMQVWIPFA